MRALDGGAIRAALSLCAAALAWLACEGGEREPRLSELARQGRSVYLNVCIACHHKDPSRDGPLGPAIAGSSQRLLAAKVLEGEYPPGYEPKRPESRSMPRFAYLADDIPALAAYLAEAAEIAEAGERP